MTEEVEALERKLFLEETALDVTDERCNFLDRNLRWGYVRQENFSIAPGSLRCLFLLGPVGSSLPVHRFGETFGYLCREILLECQILLYGWIRERARCSLSRVLIGYPSEQDMGPSCRLGISRVGPARKSFLFGHLINPLLTKPVWSRWLYIGLVLFCIFIDLHFVCSIKTYIKKSSRLDRLAWSRTHINVQSRDRMTVSGFTLGFGKFANKKSVQTKKCKVFHCWHFHLGKVLQGLLYLTMGVWPPSCQNFKMVPFHVITTWRDMAGNSRWVVATSNGFDGI